MTDDLAVVVEDGRLLVRRGDATIEVFPGEVRRLVDALVEAGIMVVGGYTHQRGVVLSFDIPLIFCPGRKYKMHYYTSHYIYYPTSLSLRHLLHPR